MTLYDDSHQDPTCGGGIKLLGYPGNGVLNWVYYTLLFCDQIARPALKKDSACSYI